MSRPPLSWPQRLLGRLALNGGCVEFTGHRNPDGYGLTTDAAGRHVRAHRVMYEFMVGPIPDGLVLDHTCRNRACVNPAHLEPVTIAENNRRGLHGVLRIRCAHGHELTNENTSHVSGRRVCRTCARANTARYRARLRAAS